jgi:hypothetical protein
MSVANTHETLLKRLCLLAVLMCVDCESERPFSDLRHSRVSSHSGTTIKRAAGSVAPRAACRLPLPPLFLLLDRYYSQAVTVLGSIPEIARS